MSTHLDMPALALAVGVVLPLVTGFITKEKAPSWVKSVVNGLLSAVAGAAIVAIHNNGNVNIAQVVIGIAETWGASIVTHAGLWSPTGVAKKVQHIASEFGFGKAQVGEVEAILAHFIPGAGAVITSVTAQVKAEENDPTRINSPGPAASVSFAATPTPVDQAVSAVVADAAPAITDPTPVAVEEAAAKAAEPVAAAVVQDAPAPVAQAVEAVAAEAPAVVAEAQADPKVAAMQAARDALDAALAALAKA